jgi:hypothetical protein
LRDIVNLLPGDEAGLQRQRAAGDFRVRLDQIRSKPWPDDFLLEPKTPKSLQAYATGEPIVFVNASGYRSDALIITNDKVFSLALEQFCLESTKKAAFAFPHNVS